MAAPTIRLFPSKPSSGGSCLHHFGVADSRTVTPHDSLGMLLIGRLSRAVWFSVIDVMTAWEGRPTSRSKRFAHDQEGTLPLARGMLLCRVEAPVQPHVSGLRDATPERMAIGIWRITDGDQGPDPTSDDRSLQATRGLRRRQQSSPGQDQHAERDPQQRDSDGDWQSRQFDYGWPISIGSQFAGATDVAKSR